MKIMLIQVKQCSDICLARIWVHVLQNEKKKKKNKNKKKKKEKKKS